MPCTEHDFAARGFSIRARLRAPIAAGVVAAIMMSGFPAQVRGNGPSAASLTTTSAGNVPRSDASPSLPAATDETTVKSTGQPPIVYGKRMFFIPYQANPLDAKRVAKVTLFLARDGAPFAPLESARAEVKGFAYHAPEDGVYQFALQLADNAGRVWPAGPLKPLLEIRVDTTRPQVRMASKPIGDNQIAVEYEAADDHLDVASLRLETRAGGGDWQTAPRDDAAHSEKNRVAGRVVITRSASTADMVARLTIRDQAGNESTEVTEPNVVGPQFEQPVAESESPEPSNETARPTIEWPAPNALPSVAQAPRSIFSNASALSLADDPASAPPPQSFGPGGDLASSAPSSAPSSSLRPAGASGVSSSTTPPPLLNEPWSAPSELARLAGNAQAASTPSASSPVRVVNSPTFDVDYDLEQVGPWGVSRVELWGTRDGGRTWTSFGMDPDNRSPVRANVPSPGDYGFLIQVDAAGGIASPPPRPGSQPELLVQVDLQPPTARLLGAAKGPNSQGERLVVRWEASDGNLEPRPIGLFYSSYAAGPWSTIATGLANTGAYEWPLERHLPERFYLRLEVRDTGGNIAYDQLRDPLVLDRPQPAVRLRDVRAVQR